MQIEILKLFSKRYLHNIRRNISKTCLLYIGNGALHKCQPSSSKTSTDDEKSTTTAPTSTASTTSTMGLVRELPHPVRHGFIPEEWFTFFYEKTGVTGPYMFGVGLLTYLFSKEIYVCDHDFYTGISLGILCIMAVKKLGPIVAEYADKQIDKVENDWKEFRAMELQQLRDMIEAERKEQWRAEGNLMLMEIKKQNIYLQLEAAYRQELWKVYEKVKNQLDYQVACANVRNRINQKNMVLWVIKEMTKELPQTDKETLEKYKADISALAMRAK